MSSSDNHDVPREGASGATSANQSDAARDRQFFVSAPSVSLPKGGGAIRGIGEKFSANPVTGTATMSVPIPTSPGRGGFGPQLSLAYDSGSGNGPFGLGWHLSVPAISRKTDKGIPTYRDTRETMERDVFMQSGAEDLVEVDRPGGGRFEDDVSVPGYVIHRYRPRIEGLFARIERWTRVGDPADVHWRSLSKDNVLTLYGKDASSRIADPADAQRIFSWLMCETRDDKGNGIIYQYKAEDATGVVITRAHEINRGDALSPQRTAHRYLKRILYGNRTPLLDSAQRRPHWLTPAHLAAARWMFEVVFDYGEHDAVTPKPDDLGDWTLRHDPFSTYRAGFEVRSYRLCRRVLMFHHFPAEAGVGQNCLVRSTSFDYRETPVAAFITAVTASAYKRDTTGGYVRKSMPRLELDYSEAVVGEEIREVDATSIEHLPAGADSTACQWVDLDGEGLSGLLSEQGGGWFYKRNESPLNRERAAQTWPARFAPLERVAQIAGATTLTDRRWQFLDLAGNGQIDLVAFERPLTGFYERTDHSGWKPFRAFRSIPNVPWNDPNLKFIDLTGDGHADILITEDHAFTWHPSLAEEGFGEAQRLSVAADEERGPRIVFADRTQSIFLADFSGDGLTDIVRIRNGEVCYWPNLGYGRFGSKVAMDGAPRFDASDQFDPRRIRLVDIDGSGATDIIYLGPHETRFWFNESGNAWSAAHDLIGLPPVDNIASVVATDLLGNGTACLVWSSSLPGATRAPMKVLSLMAEGKPHLLVSSRNNLGAETRIHYAPSTYFYVRDKVDGQPWITKLPFPVHVVERVETYDHISRNRFVTRYAYHHGYFDGEEREFRGFGRVDQWDTDELAALSSSGALPAAANVDAASYVPPVLTKTWYHTGVYLGRDHVSDFFAGLLDAGDRGEYYREPGHTDAQVRASLLADTLLPSGLSAEEEREAARALKGTMLRQEVYALDGTAKEQHPYTVTEQNFAIEMIQARRGNRNGVFLVHPRESLSHHYERDPDDPRIAHVLTLEVDEFGNVLKAAAVGYGRRTPDPVALPLPVDRDRQARTYVVYTESRVTNGISTAADYRTPLLCETRSFELTGYAPAGSAGRFRHADFVKPDPADPTRVLHVFDGEIDYEVAAALGRERRTIEHLRTLYRPDDFGVALGDVNALLPLGKLQGLALPGESYKLAFTPGLLQQTYVRDGLSLLPANPGDVLGGPGADRGGYVASQDLKATGGFPATDADGHWWIPSGRVFHSPNSGGSASQERDYARAHFFLALRFRDPFTHTTTLSFDGYDLLLIETRDPLGNRITVGERLPGGTIDATRPGNDYRLLQPWRVMDPNRNRTQVSFDVSGMVVGTAVMGKPEESLGDSLVGFVADLPETVALGHLANPLSNPQVILGRATTRMVYDLFAFERTRNDPRPQSVVVYTLSREAHDSDPVPAGSVKIQHGFAYSDGFGREIQRKVQAEPGPVPRRDALGAIIVGVDGRPQMTTSDVSPRWVGTGWTVLNNKGKPVRQFEPFFTDTHRFEFEVRIGVSPILFYDPTERVVATLNPDHTWAKVLFNPWRQETWDVTDTVAIADPKTDPDVGDFFARAPAAAYLPSWHAQRQGGALGLEEQTAARKAALLADSPTVAHADSLGRMFLTAAHNKFKYSDTAPVAPPTEEFHRSRVFFDIEGNTRSVVDAKDRIVMRYDYDMLGNRTHQSSMEAGQRWVLMDIAGKPLLAWDTRNHRFRTQYDSLRRPTEVFLQEGVSVEVMTGRSVYGESRPVPEAANLRGRAVEVFDQAGVARSHEYDFKGNLLSGERQLAQSYKTTLDWSTTVPLQAEIYANRTRFDALNRPVQLIAPHSNLAGAEISVVQPGFNEANLLDKVDVWLGQNAEPAGSLNPATANLHAVTNIDYDAKGQRTRIAYGNGVTTTYDYDPLTFRLVHMITRRDAVAFPADCPQPAPLGWPGCRVQNLHYTYDAAGNVAAIRDDAQQTIYFRNTRVEPSAEYTYDARSRLIEATGREHLGQIGGAPIPHSYNDVPRAALLHRGDGSAMGRYVERYLYDLVGNFAEMRHIGTDPAHPGWSRVYVYDEASLLEAGPNSNRLTRTTVGSAMEAYSTAGNGYDAHGNMLRLPQLQVLQWDYKDQLRMTQRQAVNAADDEGVQHQGERTWYVYDASGQRVRKVTELPAGQIKDERIYSGGFEIYRRHGANPLVRETLHIMDDKQRIALVEARAQGNEPGVPAQLIRYQFSNHLGTAVLELDHDAQIISYEENAPYGSSSYQAVRSATEPPKRYRYTGKERDEESGLYYHGARYYAPWVARWTSSDPASIRAGLNLYCYVRCSPLNSIDPTGTEDNPASALSTDQISKAWRESKNKEDFMFRLGLGPSTPEKLESFLKAKGWQYPVSDTKATGGRAWEGPQQSRDDEWAQRQAREKVERHEAHPTAYDVAAADAARVGRAVDPAGAGNIRAGVYGLLRAAGAKHETASDLSTKAELGFNAASLFAGARKGSADVKVPVRPPEVSSFLPPPPPPAPAALPEPTTGPAAKPPEPAAPAPDVTMVSGIDQVEAFQDAIRRVEQRTAADRTLAWSRLTLREQNAASKLPFLQDAMYGKAFERLLWDELKPLGTFDYIANEKGFPQSRGDFADKPGVGYGLWYDTTTFADRGRHIEQRWYAPRTVFGGYNK